jgi:hypothetical protein
MVRFEHEADTKATATSGEDTALISTAPCVLTAVRLQIPFNLTNFPSCECQKTEVTALGDPH